MATESPLKLMKNAFYFTLKAVFVLKIFKFLSVWVTFKNDLIRKIRLISKFITSKHGKQAIAIHIFPNISRSKDSQTMKFGQLTKYNMRNCFLENLYTKKEAIPTTFSKKSHCLIFSKIFEEKYSINWPVFY